MLNTLIMATNRVPLQRNVFLVPKQKLFEELGCTVSYEKSVLTPCQKLVFWGFVLDSLVIRVYLTAEKADKTVSACHQLLKKPSMPIRKLPP